MSDRGVDENDAQFFFEHGYVILKNCIEKKECDRFCREVIEPTLSRFNIFFDNPESWNIENTGQFMTNDGLVEGVPFGVMVRNPDGSDPITDSREKLWPSFLKSSKLTNFLDFLHGSSMNWQWLHPKNIGWIHLRFPIATTFSMFRPNWHVDGGHLRIHKLDSPEQSVVVLPVLQDVSKLGGNTVLVPGSHIKIMKELSRAEEGISYQDLTSLSEHIANNCNDSEKTVAAPSSAGDILVIHPFLVHASSGNAVNNRVRVTFNMGVRWAKSYSLLATSNENLSVLEKHIVSNIK